jgi:hypothetical protein
MLLDRLVAYRNPTRKPAHYALVLTPNLAAERLYARLGWIRCGAVPGFALLPQGGLCDTTFFYRQLQPGRDRQRQDCGHTENQAACSERYATTRTRSMTEFNDGRTETATSRQRLRP